MAQLDSEFDQLQVRWDANDNGVPDPGETGALTLTIRNLGQQTASGVSVDLTARTGGVDVATGVVLSDVLPALLTDAEGLAGRAMSIEQPEILAYLASGHVLAGDAAELAAGRATLDNLALFPLALIVLFTVLIFIMKKQGIKPGRPEKEAFEKAAEMPQL